MLDGDALRSLIVGSAAIAALSACAGESREVAAPIVPAVTGGSASLSVGDYVVYRFRGVEIGTVTLREEVMGLEAGRVRIALHATRGGETRDWIQEGPSSADARWNNTADKVYVMTPDGAPRELPNPENITLGRLYDWVLVAADQTATPGTSVACEEPVGAARYACTCERTTLTVRHESVQSEVSRCPGFAWQRGPARWSGDNGKVLWQVEVTEAGHR